MGKVPLKKNRNGANEESFVYDFLPYLLSHAHSLLSKRINSFAADASISKNEFKVLTTLVGNDGLSLGQLADMMEVKQPTLSRIVDGMVGSGLLKRQDSINDRRRLEITLTGKGRNIVTPLLLEVKKVEKAVLSGLGARDFEKLKRYLRDVIKIERAGDVERK